MAAISCRYVGKGLPMAAGFVTVGYVLRPNELVYAAVLKYVRKMISLPEETHAKGGKRAAQFKLPFSRYVATLIEQDYRSQERILTIVAEETPTDPK